MSFNCSLGLLVLVGAFLGSGPARAAVPVAHINVKIVKEHLTRGAGKQETVCEQSFDLPVEDLRGRPNETGPIGQNKSCKTTIGEESATVDLEFSASINRDAGTTVDIKRIQSLINVSAASTGNYFRIGVPYVESTDLNVANLRFKNYESAYLLPDMPKNKEQWSADVNIDFVAK